MPKAAIKHNQRRRLHSGARCVMARKKKLTAKQEAFAQHFAVNRSPLEAYKHAYPGCEKWTPNTASVEAQKLLRHPQISLRISELSERVQKQLDEKFDITTERVLQELAAIAFQNSADYFSWGSRDVIRRRKNKKTGLYEPMLDEKGQPITDAVPYAVIKPSDELSRAQKAAVVAVSETITKTGNRVIEAKMADKLGALKLIGQHLSMFKEVKEHTGKNGKAIEHSVDHKLPDLKHVSDPVEALKQFEALRMGLHSGGMVN